MGGNVPQLDGMGGVYCADCDIADIVESIEPRRCGVIAHGSTRRPRLPVGTCRQSSAASTHSPRPRRGAITRHSSSEEECHEGSSTVRAVPTCRVRPTTRLVRRSRAHVQSDIPRWSADGPGADSWVWRTTIRRKIRRAPHVGAGNAGLRSSGRAPGAVTIAAPAQAWERSRRSYGVGEQHNVPVQMADGTICAPTSTAPVNTDGTPAHGRSGRHDPVPYGKDAGLGLAGQSGTGEFAYLVSAVHRRRRRRPRRRRLARLVGAVHPIQAQDGVDSSTGRRSFRSPAARSASTDPPTSASTSC